MADRHETDPAPKWWSRPDNVPDGPSDAVPTPRPTPEPEREPAPEAVPEPGTVPAVRYDPWGERPLQAVDQGKQSSWLFRTL